MEKTKKNGVEEGKKVATIGPKELVKMPAKMALHAITESLTPAYLIQSLAEEDLYFLIHEIGEEAALPILARASNDQWQFILDAELWEQDRLDEGALGQWLDLLLRAAPERLVTWAITEHEDLLSHYLSRNMEVRIIEQDESPSDFGDGFFSLDGTFYIKPGPFAPAEAVKDILGRLAALDVTTFHQFLINIAGTLPGSLEDELFRIRNVRMAEKGFLPFDEAIAIYTPLSPEDLLGKENVLVKSKAFGATVEAQVVPVSKSLLLNDGGLFRVALNHISDWGTLERLQFEFAGMCNQLMSADNRIARSKDELATVVRKACVYLDMGLERLNAKTANDMVAMLKRFPLSQIFRTGYGEALRLKWRAVRWMKESWFKDQDLDFGFWGEVKGGILEGLLLKHPLYYVGVSKEGQPFRNFTNLEEIARCNDTLDEIMILDRWYSALFPGPPPLFLEETYQSVNDRNVLLTSWLRAHLDLGDAGSSVSGKELLSFFSTLWPGERQKRHMSEEAKQAFGRWISKITGQSVEDMPPPERDLIQALIDELEKEYGSVALKDLDPRYIHHFLVAVE